MNVWDVPALALAEICHHGWMLLHSHCGTGNPPEHLLRAWSPQILESGPAAHKSMFRSEALRHLGWTIYWPFRQHCVTPVICSDKPVLALLSIDNVLHKYYSTKGAEQPVTPIINTNLEGKTQPVTSKMHKRLLNSPLL